MLGTQKSQMFIHALDECAKYAARHCERLTRAVSVLRTFSHENPHLRSACRVLIIARSRGGEHFQILERYSLM